MLRRALSAILAASLAVLVLAGCSSSPRPLSGPTIGESVSAGMYGLGTIGVGTTLHATTGTWTGAVSFTYQWQDCNSSGASCTNISGATSRWYTVTSSDVGYTIEVTVTAWTGAGGTGSSASQNSSPTNVIAGGTGPTVNYFVSQSGAGSADGSSCANAAAVSTLSTSTYWTAGNVIGLCGTITSTITAQGSGTSGNPITVYWESGASLSQPYCPGGQGSGPGCFNTNGHTYLTLNGGTNGVIESTANGTSLTNQQPAPHGIWASGCTGCTIENLTIKDMYVQTAGANDGTAQQADGIFVSGQNVTITNNSFSYEQTGIDFVTTSAGNDVMSHNTFDYVGTGANWSASQNGGTIGSITWDHNTISNMSLWDTSSDYYHEDGVHCWDAAGDTPPTYSGIYIYDNKWSGIGVNGTSYIFMEGGTVGSGTVCASTTTPVYAFNNVLLATTSVTNGRTQMQIASGEPRMYNNTLIGADTGGGTCNSPNSDATSGSSENNAYSTCGTFVYNNTGSVYSSGQPDYNVYENGGSNAWICLSNYYGSGSFTSWQSCAQSSLGGGATAETHSAYYSSSDLNADGTPQAGSKVLGAGANLTSLCTGALVPLCSEYDGTARPSSGAWNAGAY